MFTFWYNMLFNIESTLKPSKQFNQQINLNQPSVRRLLELNQHLKGFVQSVKHSKPSKLNTDPSL